MLGLLSAPTPKPWIVSSVSSYHCHHFTGIDDRRNRRTTAETDVLSWMGKPEVSVWHAITAADWRRDCLVVDHQVRQRGEGSWNVAWDARPARWTHRLDVAWLLFGVCAFLAPVDWNEFLMNQESKDENEEIVAAVKEKDEEVGDGGGGSADVVGDVTDAPATLKVTGVLADGRCLFRALAYGACLQNGEEAPEGDRQTELADELRSRVVGELLKRRKETEWFIEGDFDAYVKRIEQPYNWGGEPELLMASHVLKTPIGVYMKDKKSGDLTKIANYGEEYDQEKEFPINVLFHGYGHYDIVETSLNQSWLLCRFGCPTRRLLLGMMLYTARRLMLCGGTASSMTVHDMGPGRLRIIRGIARWQWSQWVRRRLKKCEWCRIIFLHVSCFVCLVV